MRSSVPLLLGALMLKDTDDDLDDDDTLYDDDEGNLVTGVYSYSVLPHVFD